MRYSLKRDDIAKAIENAVNKALEQGTRTIDLARGGSYVSTDEMGDTICRLI